MYIYIYIGNLYFSIVLKVNKKEKKIDYILMHT